MAAQGDTSRSAALLISSICRYGRRTTNRPPAMEYWWTFFSALMDGVGDRREAISTTPASWDEPRTSMSTTLQRARGAYSAASLSTSPGPMRATRGGWLGKSLVDLVGNASAVAREGNGRESSLCGSFGSGRGIGRGLAQKIGRRG